MLNKHKRWFHSSRVKFPLVSMSASWFFVSMYLIWILESKLLRSNNQSRATLWVLETCLIVGLLPFIIILITASLSSNTYNTASWCENWTRDCTCTWFLTRQTTGFPFYHGSEACFQRLKQWDPINQEREYHPTSILHPKKWFLILLNCAKMKFASPTDRNKCMTSKNAQCSSRSGFRIFKIFCKIGVLKQSQPALFSCITHKTILFVFTCVMDVRYQTIQAFVTGLGPSCDRSCKFVHWP